MAETIGYGKCPAPGCGAKVELRINTTGRVYSRCAGHTDERACGTYCTYGPRPSETFKREAKRHDEATARPVEDGAGKPGKRAAKPAEPGKRGIIDALFGDDE